MPFTIDFFGERLNVYRACLHAHSTASDGCYDPQKVLDLYASRNYDIVCLTDHFKVTSTEGLDSHGMLLVPSAELHPQGGRIHQSHLLCINIPADMSLDTIHGGRNQDGSGMQCVIDAVNEAGGACFAAHPNWCGLRSEEVARLNGLAGMEIYNHDCQGINRGYSDQIFNELCDRGIRLPVIAVDDSHIPRDYFGGITYICCRELSIPSVMDAIRKGAIFASQGPRFTSLSFQDGIFEAHFTDARHAVLMTNRCRGFCVGNHSDEDQPPKQAIVSSLRFDANPWRYDPECTDIKQHVRWQFQCNYLQCVVEDRMGRHAWSSPVYLPALHEKA